MRNMSIFSLVMVIWVGVCFWGCSKSTNDDGDDNNNNGNHTSWERTYGGSGYHRGYSVAQTTDGGYIVAGGTSSGAGDWDVYVLKLNSLGDTVWTRTYGGSDSDEAYSVAQTSDGGCIVAGHKGDDVSLIKINSSGDMTWSRTYGGICGYSVAQTSDGGYIVAGNTSSFDSVYCEIYLIKTNSLGNTIWTRTYGGNGSKKGYSVAQTSDGGYIVAGRQEWDVYLIKTNSSGDTIWTRTYGGSCGESVAQTSDGGYIVAGYKYGADLNDVFLLKTDSAGDTIWTRTYGGSDNDMGNSVAQTSDGGYIVVGTKGSYPNSEEVYLIKTDSNGNVEY